MWCWAEIMDDKITFYSEETLKKMGLLEKLEEMRRNYKIYQKWVTLSPQKVKILEIHGVRVLREDLLALEGIWHWFTGQSRMDAFQLTPDAQKVLEETGFFEVYFTQEKNLDKLFIVSCTCRKIWQEKNTPAYVPMKNAYIGSHFKQWLDSKESKKYHWLVFSGKYGILEPEHPIRNYDIKFGEPGSISKETIRHQILYHDFWGFKIRDFKEIYFVGSKNYYEKLLPIFQDAELALKFCDKFRKD